MKKLLISFAVLALLAACNKDDDDNDVKQPEVLAKKIVKIEKVEQGSSYTDDEWEFTYDTKERIATINNRQIEYGTNTVKYYGGTYTLNDKGQATKYTYKEYDEEYTYNYEYKDGYLSKMTSTEKEEGYSSEEALAYTFKGGNLTKLVYSEIETEDGKSEEYYDTYEFTYGKQANNLNIDLMDIIYGISAGKEYLLGIAGNRSVNLPEKAVNAYTYTDEDTGKEVKREDTYTFEYKTDAEGYITEITCTCVEKKDGKKVDEEKYTYRITYEK